MPSVSKKLVTKPVARPRGSRCGGYPRFRLGLSEATHEDDEVQDGDDGERTEKGGLGVEGGGHGGLRHASGTEGKRVRAARN